MKYILITNLKTLKKSKLQMQGFAGANGNAQDYWKQSSFTYKLCCLSSTLIFLVSLVLPVLIVFLIDIPELTIWSFQVWRLFLSFYGQIPSIMSILSILFTFLWVYDMLKDDQLGTVYRIVEVVVINLEIHLLFNAICLLLTLLMSTDSNPLFFGFGWFPLIIVYEFRASAIDPEAERRFCCLPFLIKNKYYPWVLLLLFGLLSLQFMCFIACGLIGYYQECVRKSMLIKLPMGFYKKLEACLPNSIISRSDFVEIDKVQQMLSTRCFKGWSAGSNDNEPQQGGRNRNPFYPSNNNQNNANAELGGGEAHVNASNGTSIGGRQVADFRSYWAKKDEQAASNPTDNKNMQQVQIEPRQNGYMQKASQQFQHQNDSYANFNDNVPQSKQLLEEGERSDGLGRKAGKGKGNKGKGGGDSGNDLI